MFKLGVHKPYWMIQNFLICKRVGQISSHFEERDTSIDSACS